MLYHHGFKVTIIVVKLFRDLRPSSNLACIFKGLSGFLPFCDSLYFGVPVGRQILLARSSFNSLLHFLSVYGKALSDSLRESLAIVKSLLRFFLHVTKLGHELFRFNDSLFVG